MAKIIHKNKDAEREQKEKNQKEKIQRKEQAKLERQHKITKNIYEKQCKKQKKIDERTLKQVTCMCGTVFAYKTRKLEKIKREARWNVPRGQSAPHTKTFAFYVEKVCTYKSQTSGSDEYNAYITPQVICPICKKRIDIDEPINCGKYYGVDDLVIFD